MQVTCVFFIHRRVKMSILSHYYHSYICRCTSRVFIFTHTWHCHIIELQMCTPKNFQFSSNCFGGEKKLKIYERICNSMMQRCQVPIDGGHVNIFDKHSNDDTVKYSFVFAVHANEWKQTKSFAFQNRESHATPKALIFQGIFVQSTFFFSATI